MESCINPPIIPGKHAKIKIEDGSVSKMFPVSNLTVPPSILEKTYIEHREQIGNVYPIPALYDTLCDAGQLTVKEEFIPGPTVGQIMETGEYKDIQGAVELIFSPLVSHIQPGYKISDAFYATHPLDFLYDFQPDNFIAPHNGPHVYAVDFFPPRLYDEQGILYPIDTALDPVSSDRLTYMYGDLVSIITRFIRKSSIKNPQSGFATAQMIIHMIEGIFPSSVREHLAYNSYDPRVEQDLLAEPQGDAIITLLRSV